MKNILLRHKSLPTLAAAAIAIGVCGCSHSDTTASATAASTPPAMQKQQTGGAAAPTQALAAPPGYRTGDLRGGQAGVKQ